MGLFDSKKGKEIKSIKLVKKLQEEADLEWQKEVKRRREQELNDAAIAKELQAQLEEEERQSSQNNSLTTAIVHSSTSHSSASPPPLPIKPRAYYSSHSTVTLSSDHSNRSSASLPTSHTIQTPTIKPLYGMSSSSSHPVLPPRTNTVTGKPAKSYLPSETYQPELHFPVSSPKPSPTSVFHQQTPAITAATVSPSNNNARPPVITQNNSSNNTTYPTPTQHQNINENNNIARPQSTVPVPPQILHNNNMTPLRPAIVPLPQQQQTQEPPKQLMSMPEPTDTISTNYTPLSSTTSRTPTAQSNYNSSGSGNHLEPIVLPLQQQNYPYFPNVDNYNGNNQYRYPQQQDTSNISLPLGANDIVQNATNYTTTPPVQNYNPATVTPPAPPSNNFVPSATNPYKQAYKSQFSDSVLSLKPDENHHSDDEEDWDNVPNKINQIKIASPPTVRKDDDEESEIDYSDMIYDRRNEEEEEGYDPFADSFAVEVPKKPAMVKSLEPNLHILDPTLKRQLSTNKTAMVEEFEEPKIKEDKVSEDPQPVIAAPSRIYEEKNSEEKETHGYEEKESNQVEATSFVGFKTPIQQHAGYPTPAPVNNRPIIYQHNSLTAFNSPAVFNQQFNNEDAVSEDGVQVFPTNILRAGAPPSMSANNPYVKKQGAVPASDYGYYKENEPPAVKIKTLPELPKTTSSEDRHITVASVNPGQRVWIRIHPTDTGKMLAERIHIVASYQTRKVTKITTSSGRNISLNNSPLFDDWNEILHFKEGEAWTVEWVPVESPYVDIITEGKEFMKQVKANFRGSSS